MSFVVGGALIVYYFLSVNDKFKAGEPLLTTYIVLILLRLVTKQKTEIIAATILLACNVSSIMFALYLLIKVFCLLYDPDMLKLVPKERHPQRYWGLLLMCSLIMLIYCSGVGSLGISSFKICST